MAVGDALSAMHRFHWRTERGTRAAKDIEQEIRRRDRAARERAPRAALPEDSSYR